jgi:hypothetical protein
MLQIEIKRGLSVFLIFLLILILSFLFIIPNNDFKDQDGLENQINIQLTTNNIFDSNINSSLFNSSFFGEASDDLSGYSLSARGDVNGDGYDDILIGAPTDEKDVDNEGRVYMFFGESDLCLNINCSNADVIFCGEESYDTFGSSISTGGDINEDGYDDILIGAPYHNSSRGKTYLFFGKPLGWTKEISALNADVFFTGEEIGDESGISLESVGDVNGDEFDDILIGAPYHNSSRGKTYLFFGKASSAWITENDCSMADIFFNGENEGDRYGVSISSAGNVNGDNYDDILIGAERNDEGGLGAGQTYLFFGKSNGWSQEMNCFLANASFIGEPPIISGWDLSGRKIAYAGDINGDDYDDILIGAEGNDDGGSSAGQVYLFFGKSSGWSIDLNCSNANASFLGERDLDRLGSSIGSAGDINEDGFDDILIGATGNDEAGSGSGRVYLFFGKSSG